MSPTSTTDRAETLFDHILTNSSHKFSQSRVLDLGLSDHDLTFYIMKTLKRKSHKHNGIFVWSLKYYALKNFEETLTKIHFPDYLKYI